MELNECYRTLEVEPTQCLKDIKQAYRDIVFVWHPDRMGDRPRVKQKAENKLKVINSAYETLQKYLAHAVSQLKRIEIYPKNATIAVGDYETFWAVGYDQNGDEIELEDVSWNVTGGGTIYSEGTFFANYRPGKYTITAVCEGVIGTFSLEVYRRSEALSHRQTEEYINEEIEEDELDREQEKDDSSDDLYTHLDIGFPWKRLVIWPSLVFLFLVGDEGVSTSLVDTVGPLFSLALILGLIRPKFVFRFGLPNTRSAVVQVYFSAILILINLGEQDVGSIWERLGICLVMLWLMGVFNPKWTVNFGANERIELTGFYFLGGAILIFAWLGYKVFLLSQGEMAAVF